MNYGLLVTGSKSVNSMLYYKIGSRSGAFYVRDKLTLKSLIKNIMIEGIGYATEITTPMQTDMKHVLHLYANGLEVPIPVIINIHSSNPT